MCGIVGYIGTRQAFPVLIKGLKRLEYRGYDSTGVALLSQIDMLNVYKKEGKVAQLEETLTSSDLSGTLGIAHTRWATHGIPSSGNAHPHTSQSGKLALVHNGIIENYSVIKERLLEHGFTFKSETDTEVLVQFIEYVKECNKVDTVTAVRLALNRVIGAYAIVLVDKDHPDQVIAARKSSPLVIGLGENNEEFFIASDATPLVEYTQNVVYLNDEEIVVLKRGEEMQICNLKNESVDPDVQCIEMNIGLLEKGGYPHFMLKEIYEQAQAMKDCMRGRLLEQEKRVVLSAVTHHRERLLNAKRVIIVSCGTSWHAGLIGKQMIETFAKVPVEVEYASEFRYRNPVIDARDVVIAISQSGETADTLAAISLAKERGAFIFGIVNAVGSSIARITDTGTYIHVGPEIGVASTKAFTGQLTVLTMLALSLGKEKQTVSTTEYEEIVAELAVIPDKMERMLVFDKQIAELAKCYTYARNFIYLGRGYNFPVALEGALKLKEISYIHAEGYPAAEMKHGPIALVDAEMPVVVIATHHQLYEKTLSNIQEVKARKGRILAIVTEGDEVVKKLADNVIEVPATLACLSPLLTVIPLQLLAYHVAVMKGLDVDQPRNLAKSVTVE
ncbi:glutamine--fructose-6-phosphate transaminase (isomerizing) [Bacteroides graminisolvens]|uniref:Glutamine--fructose-6-phosphate aminotransferase [isomerizing] n=1 Tax=Bacteroides graminisolvens DSM 19988 = JCM 15093 TaxID=1121097 RepID=A0A069D121_9BACE|nr:glutamine--fructose-6-phosphate transaminase (isomerizing) [Bacteroides graminisolvens]GAK36117.1 glucosamine-fructose-6-phosphate aminotransferase [Bacteroides graminisolvens DSM 19988 = JCM 15093]